jgi:hypothetical protein
MRDTGKFDLPLFIGKVHGIRGDAGIFGYQPFSEIGRMLCEFIPRTDKVGQTEQMAIVARFQAMQTVIAEKVKGEGPNIARQITVDVKIIMDDSKSWGRWGW